MTITASMVKELRERTGVGMMECKAALTEVGGSLEDAVDLLRQSSKLKADKKATRVAAEGQAVALASEAVAVVLEVNSETDFVARDENFTGFVQHVANQALQSSAEDVAGLLEGDLDRQRLELVQKIGENIQVRRFERLSAPVLGCYVHSNGKIASVVGLEGGDAELARNVAMHVAAQAPLAATSADVPDEVIARERKVYTAQAAESNKPPEIVEKMVEGKVKKFFSEFCLVEQSYVRDADITVGQLLQKSGASLVGYLRYSVGEGVERGEQESFAAEVAAQLNN